MASTEVLYMALILTCLYICHWMCRSSPWVDSGNTMLVVRQQPHFAMPKH